MGMFDHIDFEMKCPLCHCMILDFQSKDGDCRLDLLKITEVENFYSSCEECGIWVEFYARKVGETIVFIPSAMDMQAVNQEKLDKWTSPEWRRKQDAEREKLKGVKQ